MTLSLWHTTIISFAGEPTVWFLMNACTGFYFMHICLCFIALALCKVPSWVQCLNHTYVLMRKPIWIHHDSSWWVPRCVWGALVMWLSTQHQLHHSTPSSKPFSVSHHLEAWRPAFRSSLAHTYCDLPHRLFCSSTFSISFAHISGHEGPPFLFCCLSIIHVLQGLCAANWKLTERMGSTVIEMAPLVLNTASLTFCHPLSYNIT